MTTAVMNDAPPMEVVFIIFVFGLDRMHTKTEKKQCVCVCVWAQPERAGMSHSTVFLTTAAALSYRSTEPRTLVRLNTAASES